MIFSHSFFPLIHRPTRPASNTLIDNIFCNDSNILPLCCGSLITDITDHYPIFCIFDNIQVQNNDSPILFRNLSTRNISTFSNRCQNTDWTEIIDDNDCRSAYSKFHNKFTTLYNDCFPLTQLKKKLQKQETMAHSPNQAVN